MKLKDLYKAPNLDVIANYLHLTIIFKNSEILYHFNSAAIKVMEDNILGHTKEHTRYRVELLSEFHKNHGYENEELLRDSSYIDFLDKLEEHVSTLVYKAPFNIGSYYQGDSKMGYIYRCSIMKGSVHRSIVKFLSLTEEQINSLWDYLDSMFKLIPLKCELGLLLYDYHPDIGISRFVSSFIRLCLLRPKYMGSLTKNTIGELCKQSLKEAIGAGFSVVPKKSCNDICKLMNDILPDFSIKELLVIDVNDISTYIKNSDQLRLVGELEASYDIYEWHDKSI